MNNLQSQNTEDGLLQSSTQQLTNLVLSDNRDTLVEDTKESLYPGSSSSIHTMNEQQWSLLKMCMRPTVLTTFVWESNLTTPLSEYTLPFAISTHGYWRQLFETFSFAKFDMHVRVQLNSTKFHTGRLAIVWNPMSKYERAIPPQGIIWSSTSLPHASLDASMSNSAEITIPFQHYYSYMPTYQELVYASPALGTLTVENLTGLQSIPPASPTVNGTIWIWFSNIELYVPVHTHQAFGPATNTLSGPTVMHGETQSGVIEQKAVLAQQLGKQTAGLLRLGSDTVSTGMRLFGLADSPTDPVLPKQVMKSNGFTSHGKGMSSHVRLALDPVSETLTLPQDTATTVDEMDLNNIIKKSALLTTISLEQPLSYSIAVSPMMSLEEDSKWYPTFLAYCANRFAFWRGPLKFRFEFVCSNFHTGRIMASFLPNTKTALPFQSSSNFPSIIMDLQEKRSFEFIVPYISQQPYKKVYKDYHSQSTVFSPRFMTGILQLTTLNEITYPGSVAPYCYLWVYVSAGEGFELAVPNVNLNAAEIPVVDFDNIIPNDDDNFVVVMHGESQSSFLTVENKEEEEQVVPILGNTSSIALKENSLYGENFMHLSNLLARQSLSYILDINKSIGYDIQFSNGVSLRLFRQTKPPFVINDNLAYFGQLFVFWRGSTRIALLNNVARSIPSCLVALTAPNEDVAGETLVKDQPFYASPRYRYLQSNAFQFTNSTMSPVLEVEIPYYTQYQNMLVSLPVSPYGAYYPDATEAAYAGKTHFILDYGYNHNTQYDYRTVAYATRSVGADFQFSYVGRPPIIKPQA